MEQTSLFDEIPEIEVKESDLEKYLPDAQKFIKSPAPIEPSSIFTQEALAQRAGMEWLAGITANLVFPKDSDIEAQKLQLSMFVEELESKCMILKKEFSEIFSRDYEDSPVLALDLETTGLDTRVLYDYSGNINPKTKIVSVSLAVSDTEGFYLPVMHNQLDEVPNWDYSVIVEFLGNLSNAFLLVFHNAQYDREVMALNGCALRPFPYFLDTLICGFITDVNTKRYGLKYLSETLLGRRMIEISQLFTEMGEKTKTHINFDRLSSQTALVYAISDSINTMGLLYHFLKADPCIFTQQPVPLMIDHKMVDTLRNLYRAGFPVNVDYAILSCKDVLHRLQLIEHAAYEFVGRKFNLASSQEVSYILFDEFKLPILPGMERGEGTKSYPEGLYSTAADILEELYTKHPEYPLLEYIIQYRRLEHAISVNLSKLVVNSFVDSLQPYTRCQAQYSMTVIPTGRLSSASNDGREGILVKTSDKTGKITYEHHKGSWTAGLNTQGFSKDEGGLVKAKKIKNIGADANLNLEKPYSDEITFDFVKTLAGI